MALALLVVLALLLAGCGSAPPQPGPRAPAAAPARAPQPGAALPPVARPLDPGRDGPEASPPPDLHLVPDALPRLEPVRPGGANKPYEVLGQPYTPLVGDPVLVERGLASWYGSKFHGRGTAIGETYNMYAMTAAHKTMPLPSYARVRNPANGREVVVRVNDRGPFHANRVIDLSYTAALKLGVLGGVSPVEVERITYEAIRTGTWQAPADAGTAMLVQAAARTDLLALADPTGDLAGDPSADPIAEIARRYAKGPAGVAADGSARPPPATPSPPEAATPPQAAAKSAPGYWLQLGAFAQRDGAVGYQQRVARDAGWLAPLMAIFNERNLHRLQAGPYASRADATSAAHRLRGPLQFLPPVVERR
jgi:rare lipoprotein A